jgi:hypothetical protein
MRSEELYEKLKKTRAFNLISVKLMFETSQLSCPCNYNIKKSALEGKTGTLFSTLKYITIQGFTLNTKIE